MTPDQQLEQMITGCRFTTSPEQEQRVLQDAGRVLEERPHTVGAPRSYRRISLRLAVVASLAAVVLVALLLRETPHTVAWADVQKKVAEQEWILVRGKANDGETFESWTSIPLKIDALKSGDHIRFEDYKNGIREVYDLKQKTVTRARLGERDDWDEKHSMLEMFNVIAKGDDSVQIKSPSPQVEIVSQASRKIEREGKPWIEFELKLRGPGEETPAQLTFLIDPDSHLIRSMKLLDGERRMTAEFSYPKSGPQSIYDLDVPKSAEVIDLRPSDEMQVQIDGVRSSAERFGPYIALNVMQDADAPWYVGSPFKVWADGNSGRLEFGLVDPKNNTFQKPEPDANHKVWWENRWKQLWHHVHQVSDGNRMHTDAAQPESWAAESKTHPLTFNPDKWPAPKWSDGSAKDLAVFGSPLSFAYSGHLNRAGLENIEAELDLHPKTGPDGTVLITLKWKLSDPKRVSGSRFWIDPKKSHIVMQIEYFSKAGDSTSSTIITNKEVAKSPRGIWYPTLVSAKTITEKDGKTTETETLTRHYLDFETEFPEGVFEPKALMTGATKLKDGEQQKPAGFPSPGTSLQSIRDVARPESEKASDAGPDDKIVKLIDNVRSSAENFGQYTAINVLQGAEAPWYVGTPFKVWADGLKVREETGIVDPNRDTFQKPDPDADRKQWWFERWNQLWHRVSNVSDGEKEFRNTAVPEGLVGMGEPFPPLTYPPEDWPAPEWESSVSAIDWPHGSPLTVAYDSSIMYYSRFGKPKMALETNPDDGPEGTVRLTLRVNPDTEREFIKRFWIDPRRSYIVMQAESVSGQPPAVASRRVIEELSKSPGGIWYPTEVRYNDFYFSEQDGKRKVIEHVTRHYLDFETKFPEGVFEPKLLPESE